VSDQKFDRFRRLERPRSAGPDQAPASSPTDARIEAVEGPGGAGPPAAGEPASGGELGRFRAPPERSLELDRTGEEAQPFLRCAACETDNYRTAPRCTTCGADLDTGPQRQFNQRFWAARRAETAAEAEASAARRAQLEREAADEAALRRRSAEALAREVGDAERRRLEQEGFGPGWGRLPEVSLPGPADGASTPWALRWLRSLPPGWALPIGLLVLGAPVLLYLLFPPLGVLAGAVALALFTPPSWRTRRRSRPW
jgi:hypothetical protein